MRYLRANTATRVTVGPFLDKADGITPKTALTVTSCHLTLVVDDSGVPTLVLDANATASAGNNDMVHITNDDAGYYDLELTAAQTNYTAGRALLSINDVATHCPVFHEFTILPQAVYDTMILGGAGLIPGTVTLANVTHTGAVIPTVTTLTGHTPQTGDSFARIGATGSGLTSLAQASSVVLASGTADSGSTTTMVDAPRTEADTDYWKGAWIKFTSGNIAGQVRYITGFNAATHTITFAPATTQAVSTQGYEIIPNANTELALATLQAIMTTAMTESYSTKQGTVTAAQAMFEILQQLQESSTGGGTTQTIKGRDQATTKLTLTLNSATAPTSVTRNT